MRHYFIFTEQLANALITLKTHFIKSIVMKLTKKQFPCLSIDIEMVIWSFILVLLNYCATIKYNYFPGATEFQQF